MHNLVHQKVFHIDDILGTRIPVCDLIFTSMSALQRHGSANNRLPPIIFLMLSIIGRTVRPARMDLRRAKTNFGSTVMFPCVWHAWTYKKNWRGSMKFDFYFTCVLQHILKFHKYCHQTWSVKLQTFIKQWNYMIPWGGRCILVIKQDEIDVFRPVLGIHW